jgi:hypothetical protein
MSSEAEWDEVVVLRDEFDAATQTRTTLVKSHRRVDKPHFTRLSAPMHLLDRVAHCRAPWVLALDRTPVARFEVTGPSRYAARVAGCPLRFVLGDDLTRACAELAFAGGARLAGCLDLLRIPAHQMWIEWNDEVHQRVIYQCRSAAEYDTAASGRRVGVFLQGSADGYVALARTFWVDAAADESSGVNLSPLETHIDLRSEFTETTDIPGVLSGGFARISDRDDAAMASLFDHVRFRFDESWSAYYRAAAINPGTQRELLHASLATVARDVPLLFAFFLLLSAKDATRSTPVSRAAINRKRQAHGRAPLLDHIEVRASLDAVHDTDPEGSRLTGRQSPRLHHVRGHLVRREDRVFWRVPHLRGSGSRGMVHSRTVCLSFGRPRSATQSSDGNTPRLH